MNGTVCPLWSHAVSPGCRRNLSMSSYTNMNRSPWKQISGARSLGVDAGGCWRMLGDPLLMFVSWFGYFVCDFLCLHQKHESASVCCETQHHVVFHSSEICNLDSKLNVWSINVQMTLFMFMIIEPGCDEAWPAHAATCNTHTHSPDISTLTLNHSSVTPRTLCRTWRRRWRRSPVHSCKAADWSRFWKYSGCLCGTAHTACAQTQRTG